jgi:hypothetical protein
VDDKDPRFDPIQLRQTVLRMAHAGSSVHIACAFSLIEILAVLYRSFLRLGEQLCTRRPGSAASAFRIAFLNVAEATDT